MASRQCEIRNLEYFLQMGRLVQSVGNLVHGLQRERGATNLYLGSGCQRFARERTAMVKENDQLAATSGLDEGAARRGVQINDHAGALGIPAEAHPQDIAVGSESQPARGGQQQGAKHDKGQGGHGPFLRPPPGQIEFQCRAHSVVTAGIHRTDFR